MIIKKKIVRELPDPKMEGKSNKEDKISGVK